MRPASSLLLAVLVFGVAFANGQDTPKSGETDPIAADVQKAKDAFLTAAGKAKERFLTAFDLKEMEIANRPGLNAEDRITLVRQVQDEKKSFLATDALPTSAGMKAAVGEYQRALTLAARTCEAVFDKAANAYIAKKATAHAEAVIAERKTLLEAMLPSTGAKAADPLVKGSMWAGYRAWPDGNRREATFEVTERDGEKFTAVLSIYNSGLNQAVIEGTVKDGRIEWKQVKSLKGNPQPDQAGRVASGLILAEGPAKVWVVLAPKKSKP